jgi:hypothetical protein
MAYSVIKPNRIITGMANSADNSEKINSIINMGATSFCIYN